jgi:hypothetical protein
MAPEATRATGAPTPDDVGRIAALPDPVIRNLEITECYSRLAAALADRIGEGANWCAYATWASRQAGRTIRREDLLDQLGTRLTAGGWLRHPIRTLWRRLLRRGLARPDSRLGRLTAELHTPFDAVERAGGAVARGNLKVFEEIGLEFARYLEADGPDSTEGFLGRLRPGDPPDGQRYLRQAFERYERARVEQDPRVRAQLAVLANLEIGLHEQTRLEPEIREALDAPYAAQGELGQLALEALLPSARHWSKAFRSPAAAVAGGVAARTQRTASAVAREIITESFMVLTLPGRVLALGTHLDDPYPAALAERRDAELDELLARFEPVPPALDDCGARDWSDVDQRMHYIVHLFCSYHLREELFRPPFTPAQVASFRRGVVPDGDL